MSDSLKDTGDDFKRSSQVIERQAEAYTPRVTAKTLNRVTLILAFIGVFIAGVLSLSHLLHIVPPCGEGSGCATVATHPSSMWFGIPVAYFGLGAYLTLAILAAARGMRGLANSRHLILTGYVISAMGMLVSVYLTYFSINVIHATCKWCLASATTMGLLFITHAMLASKDAEEGEVGSAFDFKLSGGLLVLAILGISGMGIAMERSGEPIANIDFDKFDKNFFVPKNAHILGDPKAPITIVEFGDFLCPSCKADFPALQDMVEKSQGRIRLVFRHYPMYQLEGHRESFHAAVCSECADELGKFWAYVSDVYKLEDQHLESPKPLLDILQNLNVPVEKSYARLSDENDSAFNRVYDDIAAGKKIGLRGTPTFFVLMDGVKPKIASFQSMVSALQDDPYSKVLSK